MPTQQMDYSDRLTREDNQIWYEYEGSRHSLRMTSKSAYYNDDYLSVAQVYTDTYAYLAIYETVSRHIDIEYPDIYLYMKRLSCDALYWRF